ncbi:MAG TPA: hypothetical protein VFN35_19375 [Ktedonobacteraceae bacterium]|nr:hypothetical protein [Ktedonobacteraceae bacterium]
MTRLSSYDTLLLVAYNLHPGSASGFIGSANSSLQGAANVRLPGTRVFITDPLNGKEYLRSNRQASWIKQDSSAVLLLFSAYTIGRKSSL